MDSRPVFADPSGRRHQVLRFIGFSSMAVLAAFLVTVVIAMTGGPQAPFTQWAAPQAPASSGTRHGGTQALTGGSSAGTPKPSSGTGGSGHAGNGGTGPAMPSATTPGGTTAPSPSAGTKAAPSQQPASPTPTPTAIPTASPTATSAHGHGHGNPHSSASPTPTA